MGRVMAGEKARLLSTNKLRNLPCGSLLIEDTRMRRATKPGRISVFSKVHHSLRIQLLQIS